MPVGAIKSSAVTCNHNTCLYFKVVKNPSFERIKGVYVDCAGNTKYIDSSNNETIYNTLGERICTCDEKKLTGNWLSLQVV